MKKMRLVTLLCTIILYVHGYGQSAKKNLEAVRIINPPSIDGSLTDESWDKVTAGTDFIVCTPDPGARPKFGTEIKIVYDNKGLYLGVLMHDPHPDSILCEIGQRDDENVNADSFTFCINPFNDGLNELAFKVTAAGIQIDKKCKGTDQDFSWDAVWESSVKIAENGWIAEIKIPFSAIRFPKADGRRWGINCWRNIRRYQEWSTWNFVDINSKEWINQSGELSGIKDINPPFRLSVTPYISNYYENYPYNVEDMENSTCLINGGMDVKVGLNESFTMDLTLIPDFGQVQSDNRVLNLTPFETKYDEKRPFFMEGTELFNTAGILYSRRIGGIPADYYKISSSLKPGEKLTGNPAATKMINAFKLTGRTNSNFGVGLFNATTLNTYARATNEAGIERAILTQPWTNYNILVASHPFTETSHISIINTNVFYGNGSNLANVTGFDLKIADKNNKWAVNATGAVSQKFDSSYRNPDVGGKLNISAGKVGGKFQISIYNNLMTNKFNPNDLGYLTNNNYIESGTRLVYNIFKPFGTFNSLQNVFNLTFNRLFDPSAFTGLLMNGHSIAEFKNTSSAGITIAGYPFGMKDYYEPRITGKFYKKQAFGNMEVIYSSDSRKALQFDMFSGVSLQGKTDEQIGQLYWIGINPGYRLNDKSSVSFLIRYNKAFNLIGFAMADSLIRFGQRDYMMLENTLEAGYHFTRNLSLNLRIRHYWSTVKYNEFYILDDQGNLDESNYFGDHNISFNSFNLDLGVMWRFAPGSELNILWKNSILNQDKTIPDNYLMDLKNMFTKPQMNGISFKALYYLDYQTLKKKH